MLFSFLRDKEFKANSDLTDTHIETNLCKIMQYIFFLMPMSLSLENPEFFSKK